MIETNSRKNRNIGSQRMNTNSMITLGKIGVNDSTMIGRWMVRHLR